MPVDFPDEFFSRLAREKRLELEREQEQQQEEEA